MRLCECGCGQKVSYCNQRNCWNKFLHGHNGRGKPRSDQVKSKISKGNKGKVVSLKTRQEISESQKGKKRGPHLEETKRKIGIGNKGKIRTEEFKQFLSETSTKLWEDPKYRSKVIQSHNDYWDMSKNRKRMSVSTKKRFEDPKEREKTSLGVKKYIKENNISYAGENNNMWGKELSEQHRNSISNSLMGKKATIKTRILISCKGQNISREEWNGFITTEPYCDAWADKEYKQDIRDRDNNECRNPNCWNNCDRLCIHHIDYVKKNCYPSNLITLCISCNSRANTNREYWQGLYQKIMEDKYVKEVA